MAFLPASWLYLAFAISQMATLLMNNVDYATLAAFYLVIE